MAKQQRQTDETIPEIPDPEAGLSGEISPFMPEEVLEQDPGKLREELLAKERELERLRDELARRDAALQPLPNSGPGRYRVVLRHSPAIKGQFKKVEFDAQNEQDAWDQFIKAQLKALYNPKDPHQRSIKRFENYLNAGKLSGFDRDIQKVA